MYGLPLSMVLVGIADRSVEYTYDYFHGHAWAYLFGWGDTGATVCDWIGQGVLAVGTVVALVGGGNSIRPADDWWHGRSVPASASSAYAGFLLFMIGNLVDWPTLITLLMFSSLGRDLLSLGQTRGN